MSPPATATASDADATDVDADDHTWGPEGAREAARRAGTAEREWLTCPRCGDEVGNLPLHLPSCDGGAA
jgi:hypothetical protein